MSNNGDSVKAIVIWKIGNIFSDYVQLEIAFRERILLQSEFCLKLKVCFFNFKNLRTP